MTDPAVQTPPQPASADFFIKLGFGAVAAIFGGALLWSFVAPIEGAVIAPGQVVVESNRKAVQHLEGGVVDSILVREGDEVAAGDIIVRLQNTLPAANVALIDGQLAELYALRARLEAERDGEVAMAAVRGSEAVLASDAFAARLAGQRQLFEARRTTKSTQISLLEERIVQQNERISGVDAQIASLREQRRLIEDELASVRELYEKGYAALTRLRSLERESTRLAGEGGSRRADAAEANSIIAEARLQIENLRETNREEAISQLRETEASISELEERRVAAAEALNRTDIRAPQDGRVMGLSVHTIGGVVAPGAALMEIVPGADRLQIAARVSPQDVDKVRAGQDTLVRFSSFGARVTPEAGGVVSTVSADSFADAVTGAAYYLVLIDIPQEEELDRLLRGAPLMPGMPVEAFIRTGSRPAISYFLKPLTDALSRSLRDE